MKNRSMRARIYAPALFLISLAAFSVLANEATLSPVFITGSRFASSPQVIPIAAEVITSNDIQNSSATTLAEVLGKVGGVHTRSSFTGIPDSSIDLRGFGVAGDQNTLVLINGQRLSENEGTSARLSSIPLNSIERIEILRGSGSVLYGGGSTGGAINIITRTPDVNGVSGASSALFGSYNLQDYRTRIQAANGDWGLSLNGQKYKTDNYRHGNQASLESLNGEIRNGGLKNYLAFRFGADDQRSNLPGVRKINLATGANQFISDPRGVTTPNDNSNSKTNYLSLHGERHFQNMIVALDVGRRNKNRNSFGTFENNRGTSKAITDTQITNFSPRLLLNSPLYEMKNTLTVGADWSSWSYGNNAVGTGIAQSLVEIGSQNNRAFYIRDELNLTDKTRLSFGLREETVSQNNNYSGRDLWASSTAVRSTQHKLTAHEFALQKTFNDGLSLYGRMGESFRVANIDENRCDLYVSRCADQLKPQTSKDQEIGIQWKSKITNLKLSVFKNNINNEIHYNPFSSRNMNLSPTVRSGVELAGKMVISKNFEIAGRYSRTEARFKSGLYQSFETNDNSFTPFSIDLTGKTVPLVPRDRLSINMNWKMTEDSRMTLFANHVGSQRYDNDQANNSKKMPDYLTADIKFTHLLGAWRLNAGLNNIFDKDFFAYGVANVSGTSSLRYNVYPEARRNGYISAEYRF